jgi:hypothetical protein
MVLQRRQQEWCVVAHDEVTEYYAIHWLFRGSYGEFVKLGVDVLGAAPHDGLACDIVRIKSRTSGRHG